MKMLTLNVDEPTYMEFKKHAQQRHCSAAELIREAMSFYLNESIEKKNSLWDLEPSSVGRVFSELGGNQEDLLGEMLNDTGS